MDLFWSNMSDRFESFVLKLFLRNSKRVVNHKILKPFVAGKYSGDVSIVPFLMQLTSTGSWCCYYGIKDFNQGHYAFYHGLGNSDVTFDQLRRLLFLFGFRLDRAFIPGDANWIVMYGGRVAGYITQSSKTFKELQRGE